MDLIRFGIKMIIFEWENHFFTENFILIIIFFKNLIIQI